MSESTRDAAPTQPAAQGEPLAAKPDGCILCCNGAELPPGEYCRACGRVSRTDSLLAALNKVEGRNVPPATKVAFASPPQPAATGRPSVDEVAQTLYEHDNRRLRDVWPWDKDGLDAEHPGVRDKYLRRAKAVLALLAPDRGDGTRAAEDVLAERRRQVEVEGWTPQHDDQHTERELGLAAACYASAVSPTHLDPKWSLPRAVRLWPWDEAWWKPSYYRRNLVKAGALILAEIERLDRATADRDGGGR